MRVGSGGVGAGVGSMAVHGRSGGGGSQATIARGMRVLGDAGRCEERRPGSLGASGWRITASKEPAPARRGETGEGVIRTNGLHNPGNQWAFGRVITVSERSLDAHEAHGDSADFRTEESQLGEPWNNLHAAAERDGLSIHRNANCFVAAN